MFEPQSFQTPWIAPLHLRPEDPAPPGPRLRDALARLLAALKPTAPCCPAPSCC